MLHVYTKKELIPRGMDFVFDVDAFFNAHPLEDNSFNSRVLEYFECGGYCDVDTFNDRTGRSIYKEFMSTSCKALISISAHPDKCFNGIEIGKVAYRFFPYILEGHVFVDYRSGWVVEGFVEYYDSTKEMKTFILDGKEYKWN